jgi:diguanylate cyclase (GGDEF)-like protein/PAS domain S-box-containing protein
MLFVWDGLSANLATVIVVMVALVTLSGMLFVALALAQREVRRGRRLAAENATYRAMVEALPDCLNLKDVDGRFVAANEATAKLMGVAKPEELLGKKDADFYPEALAKQYWQDEQAVLASGRASIIDQISRRSDGSQGWVSSLKLPLRDQRGNLTGLITHNRDITEQKELHLALDTARQQLDDTLVNVADGLVRWNADQILVFHNQLYHEMFPKTAAVRVPGAKFADVMRASILQHEENIPPPDDLEALVAARVATLRTNSDRQLEMSDGRWLGLRTRTVSEGGTLVMVSDITERKRNEIALKHQALHDPLTGLANRAMFDQQFAHMLMTAKAGGSELALLLIDLDHFKEVNDNFGHPIGDQLLVEAASRIEATKRQGDLVARLGGDEFALVMAGDGIQRATAALAQRLLDSLAKPFRAGTVTLLPAASIGVAAMSTDEATTETLMVGADQALYAAKAKGRGTWMACA